MIRKRERERKKGRRVDMDKYFFISSYKMGINQNYTIQQCYLITINRLKSRKSVLS